MVLMLPARSRRLIQQRLLDWFAQTARSLPWRGTRDLYAIWVSEVMLQQTQVATVIPYYQRFLNRLPTVADLAAGDEHDVLKLWEGLGYYRRARQMHAAAKVIVEQHRGAFPETFDEVLALPGIGRYTAGAILSIGRDLPLPVLEANTIRLLSRLIRYAGDTTSREGQKVLWETAESLLPPERCGDFNQALMELGALVCTPTSPACLLCPLRELCPTRKAGLQAKIPAAKKPKVFEEVTEASLVLRRADGRVFLRQRQPGERWAGMWDFLRFEFPEGSEGRLLAEKQLKAIDRHCRTLSGYGTHHVHHLTTLKHGVTRFRITLHVFLGRALGRVSPRSTQGEWVTVRDLRKRALSTSARRIVDRLEALVATD
jgi:A/G-specific adenine glycosylase